VHCRPEVDRYDQGIIDGAVAVHNNRCANSIDRLRRIIGRSCEGRSLIFLAKSVTIFTDSGPIPKKEATDLGWKKKIAEASVGTNGFKNEEGFELQGG